MAKHDPALQEVIHQGKMCSWCLKDIRTNLPADAEEAKLFINGDGTGVPTLCGICDDAGYDVNALIDPL